MKAIVCLSLCLVSIGCGQSPAPAPISDESRSRFSESLYIEFYEQTASVKSELLIAHTKVQQEAIAAFLANPNADNLRTAQRSWLGAHRSFLEASFHEPATEASSPPDETNEKRDLVSLIHAWPIQEGFLDSMPLYPTSGIINDLTLTIDEQTLRNQHGITAAEEVSLGFHAVEFLLWGRQINDFTVQSELTPAQVNDGLGLNQLSNNRRRKTLGLIVKLLHEDTVKQYGPPQGDEAQSPTAAKYSLPAVLHACIRALRNMRREVRLLNEGDQSSRHSGFSNSSAQDLRTYMQSLAFVHSDPGRLHDLFESLHPELAGQFDQLVGATLKILSELELEPDAATMLELMGGIDIMIDHSLQIESMLEP